MKIEFDTEKAAANPLNHERVTFDETKAVLLDPYALTKESRNRASYFCLACTLLGKSQPIPKETL